MFFFLFFVIAVLSLPPGYNTQAGFIPKVHPRDATRRQGGLLNNLATPQYMKAAVVLYGILKAANFFVTPGTKHADRVGSTI